MDRAIEERCMLLARYILRTGATVRQAAGHFGMSKSYLTRRTKELTGYSTQTLHERLKIEQAKNLIKSGKMKMNDIASRLGFSNPNYFSNVFKKVTGLRPTEFLERL